MNVFLIIILSVIFLMLVVLFFWINDLEQSILKIQNIEELCLDIKSSNNIKLNDIIKLLYAQSSKIDDKFGNSNTRLNSISNELKQNFAEYNSELQQKLDYLQKEQIENRKQHLEYLKSFEGKIFNELKQITVSSLEKVYHSNNEWLNKNIQELLSNDTQLKQKSETLGNNFAKYNSELQQKLDYLQKEQIENRKQLKYLQSFSEQVSESKNIHKQIQKTVSDIEKQEQILNGMIKQHTAIADYSKEIVESQESIVKLLEALMLDALTEEIDNIKK